jgi:hypothetical protein
MTRPVLLHADRAHAVLRERTKGRRPEHAEPDDDHVRVHAAMIGEVVLRNPARETIPTMPIVLADLDRCHPGAALGDDFAPGRWRVLQYVADGIPDGRMLGAGEASRAAAVAYPLGRTGRFRISIGFFNGFWRPYREQRLQIRLAGDAAWSNLILTRPSDLPWGIPLDDDALGPRITEVQWRTADLHGEDLLLRQPLSVPWSAQITGGLGAEVYVAYIRLDQVGPGDATDTADDVHPLFAYDDTWNFFDHAAPLAPDAGAEAYRTQIEAYRGTDFRRLYWEGAHGDVCHYPTRVGRTWAEFDAGTWPRAGDRTVVETWKGWLAAGFDPYGLAVDHAHDVGLELHATYRFGWGAFYWPPPFDAYNAGGLYDRHPEWRIRRPDGTAGTALSLAVPEVRAAIVAILAELAVYGMDGLALLFNRQPPFVGAEAVDDPFGPATRLLEEIRAAIPNLPLTAWVFGTREQNRAVGLDVETWVHRRLIDTVIPYSSEAGGFSWREAWSDAASIRAWTDLVAGTGVLVAPNVMPRDMDDAGHRRQALRLYREGVDALAFWDTFGRVPLFGGALPRLGHRAELEAWEAAGEPPEQRTTRRIHEVAGWRFDGLPE